MVQQMHALSCMRMHEDCLQHMLRSCSAQEGSRSDQSPRNRLQGMLEWLKRQALRLFLLGYPWFNAIWEGLRFGFQLLYLLDTTVFYSPELWLLGQTVARVSGSELVRRLCHPL